MSLKRISADAQDPDYVDDAYNYTIFFNGYEVIGVLTADEKHGYIIQATFDQNGQVVLKNNEPVFIRRRGAVEIIKRDEPKLDFSAMNVKCPFNPLDFGC